MREEVRDIERLRHIVAAAKVLDDYAKRHPLEDAQSDPVVYFGSCCGGFAIRSYLI